jgi:cyclopropane-fatty-acyl-phospholipid synthase
MWYNSLLEKDLLPDFLIRYGIRQLVEQRLKDENKGETELQHQHLLNLLEELRNSPIAINTAEANEQHYEVPTQFYQYCLGSISNILVVIGKKGNRFGYFRS